MKKTIVERTQERLLKRIGQHVQIAKAAKVSYSALKKLVRLSQKDYSALNIERINDCLDIMDKNERLDRAHLKDGLVGMDREA